MKTITPDLIKFAVVITILTILFRFFLSSGIDNHLNYQIILSAIIYGFGMFASGWYFGKNDGEYLPIHDVGFRFHFTTYLIHNSVSILWFYLGYNSQKENIGLTYTIAMIWGSIVFIHLLSFLWARRKSINDLNKEDLFE